MKSDFQVYVRGNSLEKAYLHGTPSSRLTYDSPICLSERKRRSNSLNKGFSARLPASTNPRSKCSKVAASRCPYPACFLMYQQNVPTKSWPCICNRTSRFSCVRLSSIFMPASGHQRRSDCAPITFSSLSTRPTPSRTTDGLPLVPARSAMQRSWMRRHDTRCSRCKVRPRRRCCSR